MINCGYVLVIINTSQDQGSILTGILVVMQLDFFVDLITLQLQ